MASINKLVNGGRSIQFIDRERKRRTIYLGKVTAKIANSIKYHVEQLVSSQLLGQLPPDDTARWIMDKADARIREKLCRVGLVDDRHRRPDQQTLKQFVADYITKRTDVKPLTVLKYRTTEKLLVETFGNRELKSISPGDADDFRMWLRQPPERDDGTTPSPRCENTVRKHIQITKQFFTAAVRRRFISESPFADQKPTGRPNPDRFYFISRDETQAVMDACPDAQWRLIVALSRYGGLRCPSEHLTLKWGDVDWDNGRLTVPSPKTEHHHGKSYRVIPLFPELRPHLEAVWDEAEAGTEHVITRYRDTNSNLRTLFLKIIRRAGLQPWPKLFQNMRCTRQTELEDQFSSHVVCNWIGNSE